ncbi:EXS family protein [Dipodascopsis tothii]|uniref:EXS family protein n=1 Tax=Dipodascopsis tothii TaxID=44089 RepID=UPI0034CD0E76
MKFARYLSDNLVPEWRLQYLDYKGGKKRLKKVARAAASSETARSPGTTASILGSDPSSPAMGRSDVHDENYGMTRARDWALNQQSRATETAARSPRAPSQPQITEEQLGVTPQQLLGGSSAPIPISIPGSPRPEDNKQQYGSLIATPPRMSAMAAAAAAADADDEAKHEAGGERKRGGRRFPLSRLATAVRADEDEADSPGSWALGTPALGPVADNEERRKRVNKKRSQSVTFSAELLPEPYPISAEAKSSSDESDAPTKDAVMYNATPFLEPEDAPELPVTEPSALTDPSQRDFVEWLDSQFHKIDHFYQTKEREAVTRFSLIKRQLHLLRDQRIYEREQAAQLAAAEAAAAGAGLFHRTGARAAQVARKLDLHHLPFAPRPREDAGNRDYNRRQPTEVPYHVARRKLKTAIVEYYRGLELLKSYRLLNRTGFQKITKKFDKTAGVRLSPWYMESVAKSYFGQSEVVDDLLNQVEDMFSRYFERGNRKHAVERLRTREIPEQHYWTTYLSGLWLGLGVPLFVQAIVYGLHDSQGMRATEVAFLFQLFGGAFLMVLFALLFGVNCMVWTHYKINYPFIFEFDRRHSLDYRQYLELPSFLFFWLSLCGWLCFANFWPEALPAKWYPLGFVVGALAVIFLPLPLVYHRSREWLLVALWRLLLSGLYPVEFRDFVLGDIFCSLAYSVSNIELFFCLYAHDWSPTARCGSSTSRLMGFFNALPPIWRLLQCLRRFADTRSWFPHLANAVKYSVTIASTAFLSGWRIDRTPTQRDLYIAFALVNSIYSSVWDLFMDFSLMQAHSKHPFLRDELAFKRPWIYYTVMVIDPVLRFNWIFYVIFPQDRQQSAALSFLIYLAETVRRFLWIFFRMENEHCANVGALAASRNLPLPYDVSQSVNDEELDEVLTARSPLITPSLRHTDEEAVSTGRDAASSAHMTPRVVAMVVSSAIRSAHTKDFERRRKHSHASPALSGGKPSLSDDDDDDGAASASTDDADSDNDHALPLPRTPSLAGSRSSRGHRTPRTPRTPLMRTPTLPRTHDA